MRDDAGADVVAAWVERSMREDARRALADLASARSRPHDHGHHHH